MEDYPQVGPLKDLNIPRNQTPEYLLQELRVELLRGCPLLCSHCSVSAAPKHPLQLPVTRVLTLLDEFASLGGRRVTFTGGEPLTYPYLDDVLLRASELDLRARIFSSGVVYIGNRRHSVGGARLEQLAPSVESIVYSLYAAESQVHDLLTRVNGSHAMTIEAIKGTKTVGISTDLHFVPTQTNYMLLPEVVALAADLGVRKVLILRFVPHGRGQSGSRELELDRQSHLWLRSEITGLREQYPHIALQLGSAFNALGLEAAEPCTAGIDQLVVEADGQIAPCSAFSNFHLEDTFSNILTHPLEVVWERSTYLGEIRRALRMSANKKCEDCQGCLAQKALMTGRIDPFWPDPLTLQMRSTPYVSELTGTN